MPILIDFSVTRGDNVDLVISLSPPTAIGGWDLTFNVGERFGGAGNLIQCSLSSGFPNGSSGISIQNSGNGVFSVALTPSETSGLAYGNYAFWAKKAAPINTITLSEGYVKLLP